MSRVYVVGGVQFQKKRLKAKCNSNKKKGSLLSFKSFARWIWEGWKKYDLLVFFLCLFSEYQFSRKYCAQSFQYSRKLPYFAAKVDNSVKCNTTKRAITGPHSIRHLFIFFSSLIPSFYIEERKRLQQLEFPRSYFLPCKTTQKKLSDFRTKIN